MKTIQFSVALMSIALMLGAAKCKSGAEVQKSCEGVMCTRMFAAVTVQVQDASGAEVALDSTRISSDKLGMSMPGKGGMNGGYTIVDDGQVKQLMQRTAAVTFTGYKGGREVVRQDYVVGADCCHVSKVSGPDVVTVK